MSRAKRLRGRPKEIEEQLFRHTITVDEKTVKSLRRLGGTNLSLGVREAVRILKQLQVI